MNHTCKRLFLTAAIIYSCFFLFLFSKSFQPDTGNLPVIHDDSTEYAALAKSVAEQGMFNYLGEPNTFRTPAYPYFLAVSWKAFHSFWPAMLIQGILTLITGWMIFDLGKKYFSPTVGLLASGLFLFDPAVIFYSVTVMTDTFFLFFLIASIWLISHNQKNYSILAGLSLGVCIVTRPIALLLPFVGLLLYCAYRFLTRDKRLSFGFVGLFVVGLLVLPGAWIYRNVHVTGEANLSSITGYNFLAYNMANYEASNEGITREDVLARYEHELGLEGIAMFRLENTPRLTTLAWQRMKPNLFTYAAYHVTESLRLFYKPNTAFLWWQMYPGYIIYPPGSYSVPDFFSSHNSYFDTFTAIEPFAWLMLISLAIFGLALSYKNPITWICVILVFYFVFMVGPVTIPRYRLQFEPFILILGAIGIERFFRTIEMMISSIHFNFKKLPLNG